MEADGTAKLLSLRSRALLFDGSSYSWFTLTERLRRAVIFLQYSATPFDFHTMRWMPCHCSSVKISWTSSKHFNFMMRAGRNIVICLLVLRTIFILIFEKHLFRRTVSFWKVVADRKTQVNGLSCARCVQLLQTGNSQWLEARRCSRRGNDGI